MSQKKSTKYQHLISVIPLISSTAYLSGQVQFKERQIVDNKTKDQLLQYIKKKNKNQ